MTYWTRAEIRTEARALAGRPSSANPSDSSLNRRINNWIRNKLPAAIEPVELDQYYSFETAAGTDSYNFPSDFHFLSSEGTVDGLTLRIFYNADEFYRRWPIETTFEQARPTEVLIWGENIITRAPPDDAYTIRIRGTKKPDVLSADGESLEDDRWGELVAYGVAIDLLISAGQFERAASLDLYYKRIAESVNNRTDSERDYQRIVPRF